MCNVGKLDRILRVLTGIVLIALVFIGPKSLWGWVGLIPLATAVYAYCPLYTVLGINKSMDNATD